MTADSRYGTLNLSLPSENQSADSDESANETVSYQIGVDAQIYVTMYQEWLDKARALIIPKARQALEERDTGEVLCNIADRSCEWSQMDWFRCWQVQGRCILYRDVIPPGHIFALLFSEAYSTVPDVLHRLLRMCADHNINAPDAFTTNWNKNENKNSECTVLQGMRHLFSACKAILSACLNE